MHSLVENLEKAAVATARLEELIREANSTIKSLRNAERDLRQALETAIDAHTADKLRPILEEMTVTIQTQLEQTADHVMQEFAKVAEPALATMKLFNGTVLNQDQGDFYHRG